MSCTLKFTSAKIFLKLPVICVLYPSNDFLNNKLRTLVYKAKTINEMYHKHNLVYAHLINEIIIHTSFTKFGV